MRKRIAKVIRFFLSGQSGGLLQKLYNKAVMESVRMKMRMKTNSSFSFPFLILNLDLRVRRS